MGRTGSANTARAASRGHGAARTARSRVGARMRDYIVAARRRPSWVLMFMLARLLPARRLHRLLAPARPGETGGAGRTACAGIAPDAACERMQRDGIATGLSLSPESVADIIAFSRAMPCYGDSSPEAVIPPEELEMAAAGGRHIIADYRDAIVQCDSIRRLWDDPVLTGIAGGYLGTRPHLLRSRLWWSFVVPQADRAARAGFSQDFHFDLDDWLCCKFFFYLTATTEQDGPHQFIRGSHRRRPLSLQFSFFKQLDEARIRAAYAPEDVLTLTGPAGFGFAEDPYGIHRGAAPSRSPRLILEVEYGCSRQPVVGRFGMPEG